MKAQMRAEIALWLFMVFMAAIFGGIAMSGLGGAGLVLLLFVVSLVGTVAGGAVCYRVENGHYPWNDRDA